MNFQKAKGRIFLQSGTKLLAELTYQEEKDHLVVDHTFVDDSQRGRGIADQLMVNYVQLLQERGMRSTATCSYAIHWFQKHPEYANLWLASEQDSFMRGE